MDITLAGLASDRILAYMDDVMVFTRTFNEHLVNLEKIFNRLRISGISLKLSKCLFASDKVDFLGFELSRQGIKPQARLTTAIQSYKRPSTKKELKGFLGLTGFYRASIPDFAHISQPLNALTSEKSAYVWSDDCEKAFNDLKNKLLSEPVLKFPDLEEPFELQVDASNYAVGETDAQNSQYAYDIGDNNPSSKRSKKTEAKRTDELIETAIDAALKRPRAAERERTADQIFGEMVWKMLAEIPEGYEKDMAKMDIQRRLMQLKHGQSMQHSTVMCPPPQPLQQKQQLRRGSHGTPPSLDYSRADPRAHFNISFESEQDRCSDKSFTILD
eukprot:gene5823-6520_t